MDEKSTPPCITSLDECMHARIRHAHSFFLGIDDFVNREASKHRYFELDHGFLCLIMDQSLCNWRPSLFIWMQWLFACVTFLYQHCLHLRTQMVHAYFATTYLLDRIVVSALKFFIFKEENLWLAIPRGLDEVLFSNFGRLWQGWHSSPSWHHCGQSYKRSTIVIFVSRVVLKSNF